MRSNVERDSELWNDAGAQASTPAPGKPSARAFHWLCFLGLHTPGEDEVWHAGYGFAHCRRCGDEIVTSLLSDWQRPGTRLKVVWPTGAGGEAKRPRSTRAPMAAGIAMKPISDAAPRWSAPDQRSRAATPDRESPATLELSPAHEVDGRGVIKPASPSASPAAPASTKVVSLLPDDFMGAVPSPLPAIAPADVRLPDFEDLMGGDADAKRARAAQKAS